MMIKKMCKVCGKIFQTIYIMRTVCEDPECIRIGRRLTRTTPIHCKTCGNVIVAGCRRWVYCSRTCQVTGMRVLETERRLAKAKARNVQYGSVEMAVAEAGLE